jgi:NTP pyrophosphatase (non-canonical NTP hydrolase)
MGKKKKIVPLSCDCYPGCWGNHSTGWPSVFIEDSKKLDAAYWACWKQLNIPHGSYVRMSTWELRLQTEEYKKRVEEFVRGLEQEKEPGPFCIGSKKWPGISKLIEEAGEVVQVAGKLLATKGEESHWDGTNLRKRLEEEMADVMAACEFVCRHNPQLDIGRMADRTVEKLRMFEEWHATGIL